MMNNPFEVYFSLGSNMGDRMAALRNAVKAMEERFSLPPAGVSSVIETEPVGFDSGDNFLNAAVRFDFPDAGQDPFLHALSILHTCKEIEATMGSVHYPEYDAAGERVYRSRIIDIDILLYDMVKMVSGELEIPHPRMFQREFVLKPLGEILSERMKGEYSSFLTQKKSIFADSRK